MASFPASLVTPARVRLEAHAQAVMLRTDYGDAAFLPGHTPLIGVVVPGTVRFGREDDSEERFEVRGGLVQVEPNRVVVLVPEAEPAS